MNSWSYSWTVLLPANHPRILREHSNTEPSIRAPVPVRVFVVSFVDGSSSSQPSTNFSRILKYRAVHSCIRGLIRGRFFLQPTIHESFANTQIQSRPFVHSWSHSWTVLPPANHPRIFHEYSNTEPSIRAPVPVRVFVVSFVDGSSTSQPSTNTQIHAVHSCIRGPIRGRFFLQPTIHEFFTNTRIQSRPFAHSCRAFVVLFVDGSSRMDGSSSSQPSTNFSRILECRAVHSRIRGLIRGRFFLPANHPRTLKFTPSIRAFVVPFVDGFPARTVLSTSQPPTNTRMQSRPFAHSWSHSWTVFPRGRFFLPANHPRTLECRAVHS